MGKTRKILISIVICLLVIPMLFLTGCDFTGLSNGEIVITEDVRCLKTIKDSSNNVSDLSSTPNAEQHCYFSFESDGTGSLFMFQPETSKFANAGNFT